MISFGPCKICMAKDAHIKALEAQIQDLRKMIYVPESSMASVSNIEANAVLDGQTSIIKIDESELSPEEKQELENNIREASAILSGNY